MPTTRTRKRTSLGVTGIYERANGRHIVVKVHGEQHERRFPLSTPLAELQTKRRKLAEELRGDAAATKGSLAEDAEVYLKTIESPKRRSDAKTLLGHWLKAPWPDDLTTLMGKVSRHALTPAAIKTQLVAFSTKYAQATVKHLAVVLGALYRRLDGKGGRNPVREVDVKRPRYSDPRGLPLEVLNAIIDDMPKTTRDGGTHLSAIRLRVMMTTGLGQAMVGRLEPRDVDFAGERYFVRERPKGSGVDAAWLPMNPASLAALRAFADANAWGPFKSNTMAHEFKEAAAAAKAKWEAEKDTPWPAPPDVRAYDYRHSFGTAVYGASGDIRATAELMRHKSLQTTMRYTQAGASEGAKRAVAAASARLGVPAGVPAKAIRMRRKATPTAKRAAEARRRKKRFPKAKTA